MQHTLFADGSCASGQFHFPAALSTTQQFFNGKDVRVLNSFQVAAMPR